MPAAYSRVRVAARARLPNSTSFVPEGNLCGGQLEGVLVDESKVPAQSRTAPAPKQHKASLLQAKPAAPPVQ
jgi:hypothetical protein